MKDKEKNNNQEKNKDERTNEEIRKEIEQLEELIEKVRKQNKKNRKQRQPGVPILRINLAAAYSRNFYVNLIISFLMNFIAAFVLIKLMGDLFVSNIANDMMLMAVILGFSIFEELYKKYLFKYHMQIVIYSVGTIFVLLNILFFYLVDYLVFDFGWFISPYHPILFIIVFSVIRYVMKRAYKSIDRFINKKHKR